MPDPIVDRLANLPKLSRASLAERKRPVLAV
jgi:hypothetical protein